MSEAPDNADDEINASGKIILPTYCDSHTHLVFAATREAEFVDRINGLSYEEIARRGGGILNSARKLQQTSEDTLYEQAHQCLHDVIRSGTGAVEIKSGYGLTLHDELKMLRVVKRLKETFPIPVKATLLGAHAVPLEYKENRKEYIKLIIDRMIPQAADEGLADYCDVFCDRGFFTPEETEEILNTAAKYNLPPKIHANELGLTGGVQAGVKCNAISVDHLEHTSEAEIEILKNSQTIPTLLPTTAFFLGLPYPKARNMIKANLPVALATDFNPGSSPNWRMNFVLSLACIKMKMTPAEAINAATINGAKAMGVSQLCGTITPGKKANFIITKFISSYAAIPYFFGSDMIDKVFISGKEFN